MQKRSEILAPWRQRRKMEIVNRGIRTGMAMHSRTIQSWKGSVRFPLGSFSQPSRLPLSPEQPAQSRGIELAVLEGGIVAENIVDLETLDAIRHFAPAHASYFANRLPAAGRISAYEIRPPSPALHRQTQLEDSIEEAFLFSL